MELPRHWFERLSIAAAACALVIVVGCGITAVFQNDDFLQILAMRLESDPDAFHALYPDVTPGFEGYLGSTHVYWRSYYRPGTRFLQGALWHVFGMDPLPYHVVNILLYLSAIVLVYRLAHELAFGPSVALWSALIFAIHPTHGEPVVWVAGMGGLACGTAYLLAMICFVRFNRSGHAHSLVSGTFLAAGALLFKEDAATIFLACGVLAWRQWEHRHRAIWPVVAMMVLVSVWMLWRAVVSASVAPSALALSFNPLTWMRNGLFYLTQILMPVRLVFRLTGDFSQYFRVRDLLPMTPHATLYVLAVLCAAAAILIFASRRWKRSPDAVRFGVLFTLAAAAPFLMFIESAYRLIYIPSVGAGIALAGWACADGLGSARRIALAAWMIVMSIALVEQAQSWQQAGHRSNAILDMAAEIRRAIPCDTATVFVDLPNRHYGAYLFASGFREGLMLKTDLAYTEIYDPDHAAFDPRATPTKARWFRWNGDAFEESEPRQTSE